MRSRDVEVEFSTDRRFNFSWNLEIAKGARVTNFIMDFVIQDFTFGDG